MSVPGITDGARDLDGLDLPKLPIVPCLLTEGGGRLAAPAASLAWSILHNGSLGHSLSGLLGIVLVVVLLLLTGRL